MRSYSRGQRQSLPRLRHACRTDGATTPAAAVSVNRHARIHAVAQAKRFDVFFTIIVISAATVCASADSSGSATDAVLSNATTDSINTAIACGSAADAILRDATAIAANVNIWNNLNVRNI